jgi:uncharacterized membrane protein YedE/YeeE
MESISPMVALSGGVLIGAAAAMLLLSGRIAGISGMLAPALRIAAVFFAAMLAGMLLHRLAMSPRVVRSKSPLQTHV